VRVGAESHRSLTPFRGCDTIDGSVWISRNSARNTLAGWVAGDIVHHQTLPDQSSPAPIV
jgi:hypothetical protein